LTPSPEGGTLIISTEETPDAPAERKDRRGVAWALVMTDTGIWQ
jgi:hypothetical protein